MFCIKKRRYLSIIILSILLLLTLVMPIASFADNVYKVGVVPQFSSRKIFSIWKPILTELEKRTGLKFALVGTTKIPVFESEYLKGNYDFAYVNPYLMLAGHNRHGYIPLVRDHGRSLHGIVVVRKDSPISHVKELNNKRVAFPSANAFAASLLARSDFKHIFNIKISPSYVKTHTSVYLNVIRGLTVAGGGVQKTLEQQSEAVKRNIKVIYKTKSFAPHPFATHPRVAESHIKLVKKAFIEMGKSAESVMLLSKVPITRIGEANMTDYQPLKNLNLDKFIDNE